MPHASGKRNKHLNLFGLKESITKWRAFRLGSWFRGCLNVAYDEVHVPSSKSCSLFAACLIGALLLLSYPYLGIFGRSLLMIPGQRNRCIFYIVPTLYLLCVDVCFARNIGKQKQVGLWGTAQRHHPRNHPVVIFRELGKVHVPWRTVTPWLCFAKVKFLLSLFYLCVYIYR